MERKTSSNSKGAAARDERLKSALKANLARRKAQAKARAEQAKAPQKDKD